MGEERAGLARLSALRGGATLEAVATVCVDGDEGRALELVEGSCRRLSPPGSATGGRGECTACSRRFASRRAASMAAVAQSGRERRHAEWSPRARRARRARAERRAPDPVVLAPRARARCMTRGARILPAGEEGERALRLTVALSRFWYVRGHSGRRGGTEAVLPSATDRSADSREGATASVQSRCSRDYKASTASPRARFACSARGRAAVRRQRAQQPGAIVLAAGDEQRAEVVLEEADARTRRRGRADHGACAQQSR